MEILTTPGAMQAWSDARRAEGSTIGFVPTMGALHAGHLALIADAATRTRHVVVSIFVNPLQFNEPADFDGYPRPIDDDIEACERAAVSAVYAPTAAAMYPPDFQTRVVPGALGDVMEGPGRPGHFEGVITVVTKLFGAVRPHVAIFGQKDYQQLRIVAQLSADLDLGVEIVGHPIVRDVDGVAQSSRNVRLDAAQRRAATAVPRSLDAAVEAAGRTGDVDAIVAAARSVVDAEPLARWEYTSVFDPLTLATLARIDDARRHGAGARVATAVWFGDVRLIDNRPLLA